MERKTKDNGRASETSVTSETMRDNARVVACNRTPAMSVEQRWWLWEYRKETGQWGQWEPQCIYIKVIKVGGEDSSWQAVNRE